MKYMMLIIGGLLFVLLVVAVSEKNKTFDGTQDFGWSYVKSPSGICYEVGAQCKGSGFSYTISSPVDNSYCK